MHRVQIGKRLRVTDKTSVVKADRLPARVCSAGKMSYFLETPFESPSVVQPQKWSKDPGRESPGEV